MILVSGCSWSDPHYESNLHDEFDTSFPKWFDYINTTEKVVSIGHSGYSNSTMIDKVFEHIYTNEDPTAIVIALTEWSRFPVFGNEIHPALTHLLQKHGDRFEALKEKTKAFQERSNSVVNISNFTPQQYVAPTIKQTLLKLRTLQEICNSRGIKLYVFQMVLSINHQCRKVALDTLIKDKLFQDLYSKGTEDFLNFPFYRELGGYSIEETWMDRHDYKTLTISDVDMHPNRKGHKEIGDWFNEQVDLS